MDSNSHTSNPALSIAIGALAGVATFASEHPIITDNILQLFKVIFFGVVGGFMGFFGKLIAEKIYNMKKKD